MSESNHAAVPHAPHAQPAPHASHVSTAPHAPHAPPMAPRITTPAPLGSKPKDDLSSLAIADTPHMEKDKPKISITAYGVSGVAEKTFKRAANLTGNSAVHVKTFHSIISDEGVQRLDDKINEWLENHPLVEVKNVTSNVGMWHGKTTEPSLIVNIWY
jgi:hypothetical protein